MENDVSMKKIVSLAKRRGFVFPGSEIYGGLANTYDMGPLGVEMLRNIKNAWWDHFVTNRDDMFGLDTSVLMSAKVWEASGHTSSFTDVQVDCKNCNVRMRADHLIENNLDDVKVEGKTPEELAEIINKHELKCPECGQFEWTEPREFNLLFETNIGIVEDSQSSTYLRGEIAQGMFTNFKNVLDTMHPKLPFGIAQSGKAFRNEITLGNFIFRNLEFNLAEFEYFIDPRSDNWEDHFNFWKKQMQNWIENLGISSKNLKWRKHTEDELSHYSERTEDLDFEFAEVGYKEMFGLAYRTDFDLKNHTEKSGEDLRFVDQSTGEKFFPHVVEPTFGLNRVFLAALINGYWEDKENKRTVLKLHPKLAPYRAAVFPLVRNKDKITEKAQEVYKELKKEFNVVWDDRGNIGKRYLSQDEIGTPYCITIDYDTLEDDTVTIRNRDTTDQVRVSIKDLADNISN